MRKSFIENKDYKLYNEFFNITKQNCNQLKLYNKTQRKEVYLKDPVANIYADLSSAFCTSNKNEYSLDIFVSSKNEFSELEHLLRVNYDINFVVSDGLYSQNEVRARCVILDLKNAIFTFEGNAR